MKGMHRKYRGAKPRAPYANPMQQKPQQEGVCEMQKEIDDVRNRRIKTEQLIFKPKSRVC
jgi:hypothetical protein